MMAISGITMEGLRLAILPENKEGMMFIIGVHLSSIEGERVFKAELYDAEKPNDIYINVMAESLKYCLVLTYKEILEKGIANNPIMMFTELRLDKLTADELKVFNTPIEKVYEDYMRELKG